MIAGELKVDDWFCRTGDWRVFKRLIGAPAVIEGVEAIPVQALQPTPNQRGGYIPCSEEVKLFRDRILRLN